MYTNFKDLRLLRRISARLEKLTVKETIPGQLVQDITDNRLIAELDELIFRVSGLSGRKKKCVKV